MPRSEREASLSLSRSSRHVGTRWATQPHTLATQTHLDRQVYPSPRATKSLTKNVRQPLARVKWAR